MLYKIKAYIYQIMYNLITGTYEPFFIKHTHTQYIYILYIYIYIYIYTYILLLFFCHMYNVHMYPLLNYTSFDFTNSMC